MTDSTQPEVSSPEPKADAQKMPTMYIGIAVAILVIFGVGFLFMRQQPSKSPTKVEEVPTASPVATPDEQQNMPMKQEAAPALNEQQTQQLATSASKTSKQKTFNISGGNFYFTPNAITVNKGDKVTFILENVAGVHDLVIDELKVKTPVIQTGGTATVSFTASKSGSFVYYCDIPGHRQKGMFGTLVVQ